MMTENSETSPLRQATGGVNGAMRQPSRLQHEGMRSSAVTPFMSTRMPACTTNNATINETDNIKVAVRVRPLMPGKVDKDGVSVLHVTEDHATVKVVVPGPAGNKMQRDFQFHACLGPTVSQSDVLHLCGVPQLLDAALAGYNVTIFAYGQTGSGKTYTMSGREEVIGRDGYQGDTHDGIVTRSVNYLYQQMKERTDATFKLSASYLEIYNESVCDLLAMRVQGTGSSGTATANGRAAGARDLGIKWDPAQGFFVPGLKVVSCNTIDRMMEVIRTGMKHRHVGSHELNMESSRSHSLMTIHCTAVPTDQAAWDYGTPRFGKICFVDLAGSERLKDSKSEGTMLKETTNINKSLFVLGKVISALAERDTAGVSSAHIPYRDSKLTKLLMDSLGGSALALMIACCSPSITHVEETLSTLSYATRAKNIQNRPIVQYDPKEAQITALRREIELLRQENQYLREQLRLGGASVPATPNQGVFAGGLGSSQDPGLMSSAEHDFSSAAPSRVGTSKTDWPSLRQQPLDPSSPSTSIHGATSAHGHSPGPMLLNGQGAWGGGAYDHGQEPPTLDVPPQGRVHLRMAQSLHAEGSNGSLSGRASLAQDGPGAEQGLHVLGQVRPGSGAAWKPGTFNQAGVFPAAQHKGADDMTTRLRETQALLAKFSEENTRLAKENDRLRTNRAMLSLEHAGVLDEIESLRAHLSGLETAVLAGNAPPQAIRALLSSWGNASPASPARDLRASTDHGNGSGQQAHAHLQANRHASQAGLEAGQHNDYMDGSVFERAVQQVSGLKHTASMSWSPTRTEHGYAISTPQGHDLQPGFGSQLGHSSTGGERALAHAHHQQSGSAQEAGHQQQAAQYAHQPAPPSGHPISSHGRPAQMQAPQQPVYPQPKATADVLVVGGGPAAAARSRQQQQGAGPEAGASLGPGGKQGGIIVADQTKLAFLLGDSPSPAVQPGNPFAGMRAQQQQVMGTFPPGAMMMGSGQPGSLGFQGQGSAQQQNWHYG